MMAIHVLLFVFIVMNFISIPIKAMERETSPIVGDILENVIESKVFCSVVTNVIFNYLEKEKIFHFIDTMVLKYKTHEKDSVYFKGAKSPDIHWRKGKGRINTFIDEKNCIYKFSSKNIVEKIFELPPAYEIDYHRFSINGILLLCHCKNDNKFMLWDVSERKLLKMGTTEEVKPFAITKLNANNISIGDQNNFFIGFELTKKIWVNQNFNVRISQKSNKILQLEDIYTLRTIKEYEFKNDVYSAVCDDINKVIIVGDLAGVRLLKLFNDEHIGLIKKMAKLRPVEKFFIYLLYRLYVDRFICCKIDQTCKCVKNGYGGRHKICIDTSDRFLGKLFMNLDQEVRDFLVFAFKLDIKMDNKISAEPVVPQLDMAEQVKSLKRKKNCTIL